MAEHEEEHPSGSLSASGRFARMESALSRIEDKLDAKANESDVEARIATAEALANEKWEGHRRDHEAIAKSLAEYKAASNEWRGALSDMRANFATTADLKILSGRVDELRQTGAAQAGRGAGIGASRDTIITILSLLVAAAAVVVNSLPQ